MGTSENRGSIAHERPAQIVDKAGAVRVHGATLYLVEGPEGLTFTTYREDVTEQVEAAERVMKRYRNALRELAK